MCVKWQLINVDVGHPNSITRTGFTQAQRPSCYAAILDYEILGNDGHIIVASQNTIQKTNFSHIKILKSIWTYGIQLWVRLPLST
jgi:hypothetical protein